MSNKKLPSGKGKHRNRRKDSTILDRHKLSEILSYFYKYHPKRNQAIRAIKHLACNKDVPTHHLSIGSGVNLSDVAKKNNPTLKFFGVKLDCRVPDVPVKNNYGEKSNQYLWAFYFIAK